MTPNDERLLDAEKMHDEDFELSLRPKYLNQYIGQTDVKENLRIFIEAAKLREEALDHVLLYGPPGLGKTTLANIIANELAVNIKHTSGPTIERSGDLAAILTSLEPGDVLFIDEIHRLPKSIEEILYPAMEDYCLDIVVGKDVEARSIRIDLPPFTLVGATTRAGDLSSPLRDRFGVISRLEYYNQDDLIKIVKRTSDIFNIPIDDKASVEMAKRSRGTPRIVNRLFKRVRDFAQVIGDGIINIDLCKEALNRLNVDEAGLDHTDHKYLLGIIEKYDGGPVGVEALAASISEEVQTLEDVYEPYLLQEGFIKRTRRGRIVTEKAFNHLNITTKETLFNHKKG
ncbi:Holliday junction branch migration DNA helicase RuvB [Haloplasma contractile]|uniref:Holliday junction branch migration complex subunit RuvB n=1 Tax=Haloplasma contractile SSD-17B TaxID=1033810 RepID=F7PX08_9MOLU|nr:Holliday junction branch migration DNA helicase RuvB [Haloplasma contractile]ERJ12753.1 Holliday junction ATP-dependent DNA helicase RuvB protein [Haloplasma contractile SSD-17B]